MSLATEGTLKACPTLPGYFFRDAVQMRKAQPAGLGEFEQSVLLVILRLHGQAYGVTIRRELAECTERDPSPGALYTSLDRLEEKGLIASKMGDPTPQRGGRAKRYFTVNASGVRAVALAQRNFQRLLRGLELPEVSSTAAA